MSVTGGEDRGERARFLSVAHHELNTPLAVLRGWIETLDEMWDDLEPADRRRGIVVCRRALGDLISLFEAVMADTRAEATVEAGSAGESDLHETVSAIVGRPGFVEADVDIPSGIAVPFERSVVEHLALALGAGVAACGGRPVVTGAREDGHVVLEARTSAPFPDDPFEPFPAREPSLAGIRFRTARHVAEAMGGELTVMHDGSEVVARAVL